MLRISGGSVGVARLFLFVMEASWKLKPAIVEHSLPTSRRSVVVRYVCSRQLAAGFSVEKPVSADMDGGVATVTSDTL